MSTHFQKPRVLNAKTSVSMGCLNSRQEAYWLSKEHLTNCYHHIRAYGGQTSGHDGLTFDSLSDSEWKIKISGLAGAIRGDKYKPGPTKTCNIRKPNGGFRTIHITNHIDKIPNRACLEALTPHLDEVFVDWSYGYRANRSHTQIFAKLSKDYSFGLTFFTHYDIKKAFDNVLVSSLSRLLNNDYGVSPKVIALAKTLLLGTQPHRVIGINQGEALSGLFFNLYMHEFHDKHLLDDIHDTAKIYRYADNICIMGSSPEAVNTLQQKSLGLLTCAGLECIGNNIIDLKTDLSEILGLIIKSNGYKLGFSLPESTWARLSDSLDEAHNHPFPMRQLKLVVKGWRQATKPVSWSVTDQNRLNELLEGHGLSINLLDDSEGQD
jgi:hypothetical protein